MDWFKEGFGQKLHNLSKKKVFPIQKMHMKFNAVCYSYELFSRLPFCKVFSDFRLFPNLKKYLRGWGVKDGIIVHILRILTNHIINQGSKNGRNVKQNTNKTFCWGKTIFSPKHHRFSYAGSLFYLSYTIFKGILISKGHFNSMPAS